MSPTAGGHMTRCYCSMTSGSTRTRNRIYWYAYVNGVYKDGYQNHPNGLNVIELNTNDQVNFYYAPNKDPNPVVNATAVVKIKVNIGGTQPSDPEWTLSLSGAKTTSVTKTFFEQGLACPASGHQINSGQILMVISGVVYPSGSWLRWLMTTRMSALTISTSTTASLHRDIQSRFPAVMAGIRHFPVKDIARNNSYIVANTLNGQPLPTNLTSGKLELAAPPQRCCGLWRATGWQYNEDRTYRTSPATNGMDAYLAGRCH